MGPAQSFTSRRGLLRRTVSRRSPFTVDYDTEKMFGFTSFEQGMRRLLHAAGTRGTALVVGEPGTGKTAMVRSLVGRLATSGYKVFEQLVPCAKAPARAAVEGLLTKLGEQIPFNNPPRAMRLLHQSLLAIADKNITPVVILDDAHHFTRDCRLSLKALMNHDLDSRQPLLLVFLGGPLSAVNYFSGVLHEQEHTFLPQLAQSNASSASTR